MKNNKNKIPKDQIIAKFEEFLKENNCYEEFLEGIKTRQKEIMPKEDYYDSAAEDYPHYLISCAFTWNFNNEHKFWREIDKKWQSRYKELISEEN
jgi:hypothetical protein